MKEIGVGLASRHLRGSWRGYERGLKLEDTTRVDTNKIGTARLVIERTRKVVDLIKVVIIIVPIKIVVGMKKVAMVKEEIGAVHMLAGVMVAGAV